METTYYSLEATAARLNLPQSYIRQLAKEKKIPFLNVRGRLRFNPAAVQAALDRIAEYSREQARVPLGHAPDDPAG